MHKHEPRYSRICSDLNPQMDHVKNMDFRNLPMISQSVDSIIFDPPFITGGGANSQMHRKYSSYKSVQQMLDCYSGALAELERVLCKNGILVVKCQDLLNGRTQTITHGEIYKRCMELGLYCQDIFILINVRPMMPHNMREQIHARKNHSYFMVFKKCGMNNKQMRYRDEE